MMKTVYTSVERFEIPDRLIDFISFWKMKLDEIPEQYRHEAEVEISAASDYSSCYCEFNVVYRREETPEEIKAGEEMLRKSRALTEEKERLLLKQLKEKYE